MTPAAFTAVTAAFGAGFSSPVIRSGVSTFTVNLPNRLITGSYLKSAPSASSMPNGTGGWYSGSVGNTDSTYEPWVSPMSEYFPSGATTLHRCPGPPSAVQLRSSGSVAGVQVVGSAAPAGTTTTHVGRVGASTR